MASFSFLIGSDNTPTLSNDQYKMIVRFCEDYSALFSSFESAYDALGYFDQEDDLTAITELGKSCFHNKDYLEHFAVNHYDAITQFIEHTLSALGPPNDYPDERLDNMFGQIDIERDDFAFVKLGKIGVHIAGKLLNDNKPIAEQELKSQFERGFSVSHGLR